MFKKTAPVLLLGSALLAISVAAMAQDNSKGGTQGKSAVVPTVAGGGSVTIDSLIERYTGLAGSVDNASSLVKGLQTKALVTLTITVMEEVQVQIGTKQITEQVQVPIRVPAPPPAPPGTFTTIYTTQTITREVPVYGTELRPRTESLSFTPPTAAMGLGNVDIALALTQALVTQQAVSSPNPKQLYAAMMDSGSGILQLRAGGMGWGEIAKSLGFQLK